MYVKIMIDCENSLIWMIVQYLAESKRVCGLMIYCAMDIYILFREFVYPARRSAIALEANVRLFAPKGKIHIFIIRFC